MEHTLQHPISLAHLTTALLAIVVGFLVGVGVVTFAVILIGILLMVRFVPRLS